MTATITAVEYWQHIIDATLYAIDNDENEARRELAAAERIMPVPEEAWRAVLDASADDEWVKDAQPYLDLQARYLSLYENYQRTLTALMTHHEEQAKHYEDMSNYVDKEYQPR